MKKPGIILSIIIGTIMFIYAMSFISSQNVCSGVRSYECAALQKKTSDAVLAKQADEFAKMMEASTAAKTRVVQTTPVIKQAAPVSVQQISNTNNTQQAAVQQAASATVNTRTRAS